MVQNRTNAKSINCIILRYKFILSLFPNLNVLIIKLCFHYRIKISEQLGSLINYSIKSLFKLMVAKDVQDH